MTRVTGDEIDIALRLLDHQLRDSDEVRCGKVDDVLLERDGQETVVTALLSGPRAQRRRLPGWAGRFSRWFGRDVEHRVPWKHVKRIEATIELDLRGEELGLGAGDRNAADLIPERLPRS
jgi:sporulation protein YlmC with PRC-barrel domain